MGIAPEQATLIRERALQLLTRREHSAKELRDKLAQKFNDMAAIEAVIARLQEVGLQSDARYTELFVRHKTNTGKGPFFIRQLLSAKGINAQLMNEYLDTSFEYWLPYAREAYQRKYRDKPIRDYAERSKRQRFLMSRGFSQDVISQVLAP